MKIWSFLHINNKISYKIENIDVAFHLKHRVNFFDSVANSQSRKIILKIKNKHFTNMSKIELDRLIDNNLSNAIKYSYISSEIKVILENSTLEFISQGDNITYINKIFDKYSRENNAQGGHGLGLSIVKSISEKYTILIDVKSSNNINSFSYTFK